MLILFEAWKYTDEYWTLLDSGVKTHEDEIDYSKDCYLDKILINVKEIVSASPCDEFYIKINDGDCCYLLNIHFNDFCQLSGYVSAKSLKNKWAN